jgi:hypothetical protein
MLDRLNERERAILKMALSYAYSNADDVCDAFARSTEQDPDNEDGKCSIDGVVIDPPTDEDINRLAAKLGLGRIA